MLNKNEIENLQKAQYGTHIIVPLKLRDEIVSSAKAEVMFKESVFYQTDHINEINMRNYRVNGTDLTEYVNRLFDADNDSRIASVSIIDKSALVGVCFQKLDGSFFVELDDGLVAPFDIDNILFYRFDTNVAFICLSFRYHDISIMRKIFNPSLVRLKQSQRFIFDSGVRQYFSFKNLIENLIERAGYTFFYDVTEKTVFSDGYALSLAVIPERTSNLNVLKKAAFNLQRMLPLDSNEINDSVIHSSFYTFPNASGGSYQWCANVGGCSISRVRCCDEFERQTDDLRANTLTLIMLALYQRFSSLLFSDQLRNAINNKKKRFSKLENDIIHFQSFGEISSANVSRIASVRELYHQLFVVNGVYESLEEINKKLKIIAEHEEEYSESRINIFMIFLSLFGIVSIIVDTISIVESIMNDDMVALYTLSLSVVMVFLLILSITFVKRRR